MGNWLFGSAEPEYKLTGWKLKLSKCFFIPQRYVLAIMGMFAICNAYTMRVCLNMAITEMVPPAGSDPKHRDPNACPVSTATVTTKTFNNINQVIFQWDEKMQGLLLGSFYYGYAATHIPGGILSEKYGGKWVLGLGLLSTAVCTVATPFAVKQGGFAALFVLRVVEGLGEGPTMPGMMAVMTRWAPKNERGIMGAIIFGGAQIGNIAGNLISGFIMDKYPWDIVFYVFGAFGVLWFILWSLLCFSTPNTHPYISVKERAFLNKEIAALNAGKETNLNPVPWKAILRSVPLWALIIAAIGHDWGYFTMVTDLPKYMRDVLKFNIKNTGMLSSLPYLFMWVSSCFFGLISDYCIKHGYHSILTGRKLYTTVAAAGPGVAIILASYSGCSQLWATIWFVISMTLMGAYYTGMKINALDISPNYAGTTTAIVNGTAAISAIIVPYLIGVLTPESTLLQWRIAFWVNLGVLLVTNIVYVIWAKADPQWWDDVDKYGYPPTWKRGPLPKYVKK